MGLFKKARGKMSEIGEAQGMADQASKDAGMDKPDMFNAGRVKKQGTAARDDIHAAAEESNRILTVGNPGSVTIVGHTGTGESVAGNPIWILQLEVTPEGGSAYTVEKREIVPRTTASGYADGITMQCRIDPADQNLVAFGDKAWR